MVNQDRRPDEAGDRLARDVLDLTTDGCIVVGFDWRYLYVNDAAARFARQPREAMLGRTMMACDPRDEQSSIFWNLRQCMIDRKPSRCRSSARDPDGTFRSFDHRFTPVPDGVAVVSDEVTNEALVEAVRAREAKTPDLAYELGFIGGAIGALVSDVNCSLVAVLGYSAILLDDLPADDPRREDLEAVQRAAERAVVLSRRCFAGMLPWPAKSTALLDLNDVVIARDRATRHCRRDGVEQARRLGPDLWRVRANAEQVAFALDLLADDQGYLAAVDGTLTIETGNVVLAADVARRHPELAPGSYVRLAVIDARCGAGPVDEPPEHPMGERAVAVRRALVQRFAELSGGLFRLDVDAARGATIELFFPRERDGA
jgi:hypothetical protein